MMISVLIFSTSKIHHFYPTAQTFDAGCLEIVKILAQDGLVIGENFNIL
ncbi:hypothetical protein [Paenibacillus qinlingensis]|uniref:Uncharacterized protein n=1 Tax=Paenibacillus qinlingensis TaxID=1837343 RepID=A0ABU1NRF1_9BACL|nr:hypothetical protein [Paenibacillus qinlingensis]MDR6550028.1 hypothetical protein [Paenibacillus qinlingensis]